MRARSVLLTLLVLVLLAGSGCAANKAVNQAGKMLVSARDVHADYLAPYEFTLAQEYYFEAQKQLDQSDFSSALEFARRSLEAGHDALALAQQRQKAIDEGALP